MEQVRFLPLTDGRCAMVDARDYLRLRPFRWRPFQSGSVTYACCGGSRTLLHRAVLAFPAYRVDHRNRNGLDCRRRNLRAASSSQNGANSRPSSNNTSGHKGVVWIARLGKWKAQIGVRQEKIYLGVYETIEEAATAYGLAAQLYFGDFARLTL